MAELLYIHPALHLADLGASGKGYVARRAIRRGELLLEEQPFVWDAGKDPQQPDLTSGTEWLLRTGAVHDLPGPPGEYVSLRERAEAVASRCAFRLQSPCADGAYPAMLFRASSRFNHSCFPNAGAYLPGGAEFATVTEHLARPMATFAIEDVSKGEEVCISYLSDADQLSPTRVRQASLQEGWGFVCACKRCKGGRPLDRRLEGLAAGEVGGWDPEQRRALAAASRDFRALFEPSSEEYNPPEGDFQATVERLTRFREQHKLLDGAHCFMQRVRRELLAAFLLDGAGGEMARRFAEPAAALLIEEMQIAQELLPMLSPCKVPLYARFLRVLKDVPEKEADWLRRDVKVDGCGLWHCNALWLHDPGEAARLGAEPARNLPARPAPGPRPRTGPAPAPGACCLPGLGDLPAARCAAATSSTPARQRWPRRRGVVDDEMPDLVGGGQAAALVGQEVKVAGADFEPPADLWEAYREYGRPSAAARALQRAAAARRAAR